MTEPTTPPDESAEAFGAALATIAATEAYVDGLTPAELNEIGRRAGEAITRTLRAITGRAACRRRKRARGSEQRSGPLSKSSRARDGAEGDYHDRRSRLIGLPFNGLNIADPDPPRTLCADLSCSTVIRTRLPARRTLPSTT